MSTKFDKAEKDGHYYANDDAAIVAPTTEKDYNIERTENYDPSKESFWTRAGLNFESYKRAPGRTG
jgi:amino acid transporter